MCVRLVVGRFTHTFTSKTFQECGKKSVFGENTAYPPLWVSDPTSVLARSGRIFVFMSPSSAVACPILNEARQYVQISYL